MDLHLCVKRQKTKIDKTQNEVVKQYQDLIDLLVARKKTAEYGEQRAIEQMCAEIRRDQFCAINKCIQFKHVCKGDAENNLDWVDMDDYNHVAALLRINNQGKFDSWLKCIKTDLQDILNVINWDNRQKLIINMLPEYNLEEIATLINISRSAVYQAVHTIIKRILKESEKNYIDYKTTYWIKGQYKTCSCCEQTKLVTDYYNGSNVCKRCKAAR